MSGMAKTKSTPPRSQHRRGSEKPSRVPTLGLRELAQKIGINAAQLSRESKKAGFPHVKVGSAKRFVAGDVLAWRAQNVRVRKGATVETKSTPPGPVSLADKNDPHIRALLGGDASPLTITRAAMQMASRRVAESAMAGTLGVGDLDGLKKTLQELRAAESDYDAMQIARGELVTITEVESVVGQCCSRLVRCLSVLENSIVTEIELWLADEKFRALPVDERKQRVRAFIARTCHQVREQEAKGVRGLMAEMSAADDQAGGMEERP